MQPKQVWYKSFFDDFLPYFAAISKQTSEAEVHYIIRKLHLKRGSRFLDCPCGIGRISLPVAKRGIRVTGVDLTKSYLDVAARGAREQRLPIRLVHADMRRINFLNEFDAAGNLWTSFGYFEKESDNLLVLKKAYQALKPGGRFVLQVANRDWVIAHFVSQGWEEAGGVVSWESREFDYATSTNRVTWRLMRDGKVSTHQVNLRMYTYHEMIAMFRKVGFIDIAGFGGTKDQPISKDKMYMWIFGTKPKRKG
jgi:SAM-dependent methyltransferase